jgi:capsular polysaccharide biosynthesis protein
MSDRETQNYGDEIDLFQYWLVLQNHWKMILAITLSAMVIAAGASFYIPKVFLVTTTINIGRIYQNGDRITTVANMTDIQQVINTGSNAKSIVKALKLDGLEYNSALGGNITSEAKENAENILIKYETTDPKLGIKILDALVTSLQGTFNNRAIYFQNMKESEIQIKKAAIQTLEAKRQAKELQIQELTQQLSQKEKLSQVRINILNHEKISVLEQISRLKERIDTVSGIMTKLSHMSSTLEQNTQDLLKGKNELTKMVTKEGILPSILFSNNIQQNISFLSLDYERVKGYEVEINDCRKQIDQFKIQMTNLDENIKEVKINYDLEIAKMKSDIQALLLQKDKEMPAEIEKVKGEIASLGSLKLMIEGIKVVSPPDYHDQPIKPRRSMIVSATGLVAFIGGIVIAFLWNWQQVNKKRYLAINHAMPLKNAVG